MRCLVPQTQKIQRQCCDVQQREGQQKAQRLESKRTGSDTEQYTPEHEQRQVLHAVRAQLRGDVR
jgi:hypothetical protein